MPTPASIRFFAWAGRSLATLALASSATLPASDNLPRAPIQSLRITVLSTNLAERGVGEWGYAALVESDGFRLLFDTGHRPETALGNARELDVDLAGLTEVVLSHHHIDHVGGLPTLRRAFAEKNPAAFSRIHVATGAFLSRGPGRYKGDDNPLIAIRPALEESGARFVEHDKPFEIHPGIWFTGPIPRAHPDEQPIPPGWVIRNAGGELVPDPTPDDAALVFDTVHGLVVLTGCGHAGLINTLEYARVVAGKPDAPIHAVLGGFHLFQSDDDALSRTADHLRALGLRKLHGGHCTGLETIYRFRKLLGLPRESASVAAVGSWFDLVEGIHPLNLAR